MVRISIYIIIYSLFVSDFERDPHTIYIIRIRSNILQHSNIENRSDQV